MQEADKNTVYILDSYGLIYRCYFAFINRPLTNKNGQNVSALFGFFRNLHSVLQHYKPAFIAAAMDSKTATFRHKMYDQYKANRPKTPEDLHSQIPLIEEVLCALGIPILRCDGYEADDVIATVSKKCHDAKKQCRILSGDKDLMQLVDDSTWILKPDAAATWKLTGTDGVIAEWGVTPPQLLDLLSLYGDTADNIPGVQGIGVKTAGKLLSEYFDLDGIYAHIDEIKGAVQKKLIDGKQNAYFSRDLVRLCNTVPCPDLDSAIKNEVHLSFDAAAKLLFDFGVPAVAKQYATLAEESGVMPNEGLFANNAAGLPNAAAGSSSVALSANSGADSQNAATGSGTAAMSTNSAAPTATNIPLVQNTGDYRAITSKQELSAFVDAAISAGTVAYDSETDSLDTINGHIAGFSLSYEAGKAVYVPLASNNIFESAEFISKQDAFTELFRLFNNPNVTVVLHNAKFDLKMLFSNGFSFAQNAGEHSKVCPKCRIADTMVAYWLLNPDKTLKNEYSLESLAENILHVKGIEFTDIVAKNQTFMDVPLQKAVPYASEDADLTLRLWQILEKQLTAENLSELFWNTEMRLLPVLAEMELTGIHLDANCLRSYNAELSARISECERQIYAAVGHEFNIASPLQLQTVLFEERKLKPGKKTKRGYSTDTSVLEELALYDEVPKMILEFRELSKLKSTYVETLPELCGSDGRIHPDFIQTGTATGRLSCREPNLQNIPVRNEAGRKIRSAFTAPSEKVLISADYSQIELVVLAHLSGDKNMTEAFCSGDDIHRATAALIFGVPKEAVTAQMRRTAKTINFGVIYGMSAFRLAGDLGISRTEASQFIENYFSTYSNVRNFISNTISGAEETGFVQTLFGRKRRIPAITSVNKMEKSAAERIAVNTPVQGSAADIVKKAMLDVHSALNKKNNGAKLLLQVHDELIVECPDSEDVIQETIALIREKMEGAVKLSVPLKVSVEYGKNWGEFH